MADGKRQIREAHRARDRERTAGTIPRADSAARGDTNLPSAKVRDAFEMRAVYTPGADRPKHRFEGRGGPER
jgi:hypothetical protein